MHTIVLTDHAAKMSANIRNAIVRYVDKRFRFFDLAPLGGLSEGDANAGRTTLTPTLSLTREREKIHV
jgi:hypothetical protein